MFWIYLILSLLVSQSSLAALWVLINPCPQWQGGRQTQNAQEVGHQRGSQCIRAGKLLEITCSIVLNAINHGIPGWKESYLEIQHVQKYKAELVWLNEAGDEGPLATGFLPWLFAETSEEPRLASETTDQFRQGSDFLKSLRPLETHGLRGWYDPATSPGQGSSTSDSLSCNGAPSIKQWVSISPWCGVSPGEVKKEYSLSRFPLVLLKQKEYSLSDSH